MFSFPPYCQSVIKGAWDKATEAVVQSLGDICPQLHLGEPPEEKKWCYLGIFPQNIGPRVGKELAGPSNAGGLGGEATGWRA